MPARPHAVGLPRVVPVLDLQRGLVVRGVAGRRHEYRPLESRLCRDARPASVARALVETFGFATAYVADLDAIAGDEPAWDDYRAIAAAGLRLWIDAGLSDLERARRLAAFEPSHVEGVIAGLESLPDLDTLRDMLSIVGARRLIFSLDLFERRPRTDSEAWKDRSAEQIAEAVVNAGIERMIVLDVAGVGLGQGIGTLPLCRHIHAAWPSLELTTGGGVRRLDDLRSIAEAGGDAALVASALHDGRLTPPDLAGP